jgi:hypothetical protein
MFLCKTAMSVRLVIPSNNIEFELGNTCDGFIGRSYPREGMVKYPSDMRNNVTYAKNPI